MTKAQNTLLESAKNSLNIGNIDEAKRYVKKIKNYNRNAEATYILALCHAMKNEFSQAEKLFSKTINLSNHTESLLGNLGLAQLHQQKIQDAIKSFLGAIKINPNYYDALRNLATCYDHIGDQINAIKYANIANNINPNDPAILNIMAKHTLHNGNAESSIILYTKSLKLQPQQPYIYTQLANAHIIAKQYDTAEKIFKNMLSMFPDTPFPGNSLANYYETRNQYNKALCEYENIVTKYSKNMIALAGKSRCLIALKEFDKAHEILLEGYSKYQSSPEICSELCNYFILIKNYEAAYNVSKKFLSTLQSDSEAPESIALSHSTACKHSNRPDEARNILTSFINKADITREVRESLYFSLADVLDDIKQYDDAFQYYKSGNEVIRKQSDILYYETVLTDISTNVNRSFLDSIASSGNQSKLPVFIVGMPRSGTSLIEQILASHKDIHGGGELTDLWNIGNNISGSMNLINYAKNFSNISHNKLKAYSEEYIQALRDISNNKIRVTDKLPHNFMHIGLIEKLFPNAKIIHCQRHPFDTCLSIYFKKFNDNHVYSKSLEELARFYKKYISLMEHWYRNSSLSIITVNYEDMVSNQESESYRLIEHIGLEWDNSILKFYNSGRVIMTPSYHQASKPIYNKSVNRWKNYINFIQPIEKILGNPEKYL